jgi:phosphoglycolate phosphatase-like HAD superfamily hydrolase
MTADWQAIIFDFDGVVVESGDIKTQAFAELYRPHGEAVTAAVVQYHRLNGGMSRYQKFRYFQQHLLRKPPLTPDEEQELDRQFSELVVEAIITGEAVPGADAFIRQQAARIPLFVASGTPEIELNSIVMRRGLAPYFTGVRGSPTSKQALIADILSTHAFAPERVLMIGDALIDYQSAQLNGVAFLGRVRAGDANPFPPQVETVADLSSLLA